MLHKTTEVVYGWAQQVFEWTASFQCSMTDVNQIDPLHEEFLLLFCEGHFFNQAFMLAVHLTVNNQYLYKFVLLYLYLVFSKYRTNAFKINGSCVKI